MATASTTTTKPAVAPPPAAVIRPFDSRSDLKVTQYLVGASILEPAAAANQAALYTPYVIVIWILFTHLLVERYGTGWPSSLKNVLAGQFDVRADVNWSAWAEEGVKWLRLAPIVVAPPIVLLALFEFRHRNAFEREMVRVIGEEDMTDVEGYYGTTKQAVKRAGAGRSGFWVLEYDSRIIGAFGLDGVRPGKGLDSIVDKAGVAKKEEEVVATTTTTTTDSPRTLRPRKSASTLSTPPAVIASTYTGTLQLRRFATSLSFRSTGIEDDLLSHAATYAFSPSSTTSSPLPPADNIIISVRPSVQTKLVTRLINNGYTLVEQGRGKEEVRMEDWKVNVKVGVFERIVTALWPLDLSWRTYVLERRVWEARQ